MRGGEGIDKLASNEFLTLIFFKAKWLSKSLTVFNLPYAIDAFSSLFFKVLSVSENNID